MDSCPGHGFAGRLEADSLFCAEPNGSDLLELYNLKTDLSETRNVAAENPKLVKELNQLIGKYLQETEAVIPKLNPSTAAKSMMEVAGWTPSKDAKLQLRDGAIVVTSGGKDPSLVTRGLPAGMGPYTVELTLKSKSQGSARFSGHGNRQDISPRSVGSFEQRHDGEKQTLQVKLPVDASLTAIRIDPSTAPGEIEFTVSATQRQRWQGSRRVACDEAQINTVAMLPADPCRRLCRYRTPSANSFI